jgi:hypothetical protein
MRPQLADATLVYLAGRERNRSNLYFTFGSSLWIGAIFPLIGRAASFATALSLRRTGLASCRLGVGDLDLTQHLYS